MNAIVDVSNVVLETKRLILRPWAEKDLEDFYEYAKVDGVGQMAGWNPHKSIHESRHILNLFLEEKKTFSIQLKETSKVIGSVGLEMLSVDLGHPYTNQKGREVGYVLSREYLGLGIMPEAVKGVVQYYFNQEHYDFLQCSHSLSNSQSQRVIEKCGFAFV
jgi:Acetyltransferases, including N-acetylases of ribosomal proteins